MPERVNEYNARWREKAFSHYGWLCACCGEADPRFLCLDHVDGDGGAIRNASTRGRRLGTIPWACAIFRRTGVWPAGIQTMCAGCNWAKGSGPVCPHRVPIELPGQLALFGLDLAA